MLQWIIRRQTILSGLVALAVSACVNNYEKFYVDQVGTAHPDVQKRIAAFAGEPEIFGGTDLDADNQKMVADGYYAIGYASFDSTGGAGQDALISQARKVGAEKVTYYQKYLGSESSVLPIVTPTTQTTFHSGGLTAYGAGGSAFGSYSGTSTTYGTSTSYIPVTKQRHEHTAIFWARLQRPVFGVQLRDPSTDEQMKSGTTRGSIVATTVRGSPAYEADLVPGDLIIGLNGNTVHRQADVIEFVMGHKGQTVTMDIIRNGKRIAKTVTLGN